MNNYQIIKGIPVFGEPQYDAVEQMLNCQENAVQCALMADHHLGYAVPIGGVIAYKDMVSPSGVGYDIGCGVKAVLTNIDFDQIKNVIPEIMDDIVTHISFGVGRINNEKVEHALFDDDPAWNIKEVGALKDLARSQLGTVGSGNHYVDIFKDRGNCIWVGCHFGSRGLGHKIATHFIKALGGKDGINVKPTLADVNSDIGEQYILAMTLAGRYAYAGRDWVCNKVCDILNANIIHEVHNHHNFAWKEEFDDGQEFWVVRKGATPCFPCQQGMIGATMCEPSYIVEGLYRDSISMNSTVHGAGRLKSRKKAKQEISNEQMNETMEQANVVLRGGGVDESRFCYKRLDEVLKYHNQNTKIMEQLIPLGVAMAGNSEFDPYKD